MMVADAASGRFEFKDGSVIGSESDATLDLAKSLFFPVGDKGGKRVGVGGPLAISFREIIFGRLCSGEREDKLVERFLGSGLFIIG